MLLANREWHALGQRQDHPLGLIQYEDVMDITIGQRCTYFESYII